MEKTEARIQENCVIWFWNEYPEMRGLLFEIANNAFSAQSGMKHKAMGRVAGVADMCLLLPTGRVVFVEFKTATGRQSPVQATWQERVERAGFQYRIIRSLVEFQVMIFTLWPRG